MYATVILCAIFFALCQSASIEQRKAPNGQTKQEYVMVDGSDILTEQDCIDMFKNNRPAEDKVWDQRFWCKEAFVTEVGGEGARSFMCKCTSQKKSGIVQYERFEIEIVEEEGDLCAQRVEQWLDG